MLNYYTLFTLLYFYILATAYRYWRQSEPQTVEIVVY